MPFVFKYTYTNYPFSPKATARSKQLGLATCPTFCVVVTIVFFLIFFAGIDALDIGLIIMAVASVASVFLGKFIRSKLAVKVENIAMADLLALRDTDPEAYKAYSAMFWQELHRYQSTYGYQTPYGPSTPPRQNAQGYQAPPVSYTPPQQNTTIRQESAPVVPQSAPQEEPAFDIQEEIPEVIEMPETMPPSIVQEEEIPKMVAETDPVADTAPIQETPVQAKKFCSKCGTKLKPESAFCHRCGSRL